MAVNLPGPIDQRVKSVLEIALLIHEASAPGSSAQKGAEREVFINHVLREALPPTVRFGTGSVSDLHGNESGQLDIVLEGDSGVSFSMPGVPDSRFYLSNHVGAVIEVKSTLDSNSWGEALKTADKLAKVQRSSGSGLLASAVVSGISITEDGKPMTETRQAELKSSMLKRIVQLEEQPKRIPFYVVGYKGWKELSTLEGHLSKAENVDGVFIVDGGLWVFKDKRNGAPAVFGQEGHAQLVAFMTQLLRDCQFRYESIGEQFSIPA